MIRFLTILFLSGCFLRIFAVEKPDIIENRVSFGHKVIGKRTPDAIIIHSVYNASGGNEYDIPLIINQFKKYNVSAHYLIDRNGLIYRLVADMNVAYHAGKSSLPDGSTNLNSRSIGIELVTNLQDSISSAQTQTLTQLVKYLQSVYTVKFILRHSDIAPGRKTDPWNFNWKGFLVGLKSVDE